MSTKTKFREYKNTYTCFGRMSPRARVQRRHCSFGRDICQSASTNGPSLTLNWTQNSIKLWTLGNWPRTQAGRETMVPDMGYLERERTSRKVGLGQLITGWKNRCTRRLKGWADRASKDVRQCAPANRDWTSASARSPNAGWSVGREKATDVVVLQRAVVYVYVWTTRAGLSEKREPPRLKHWRV